jgi:integrase
MATKLTTTSDKTKPEYWSDRLFHRGWQRGDKAVRAASWYVRIKHDSQRHTLNLDQTDRRLASRKACAIYSKVKGAGWDAAFEEFGLKDPASRIKHPGTIGEYIKIAAPYAKSLQTHTANARCLRLIASELCGVKVKADEARISHIATRLATKQLQERQAAGDAKVPADAGKRHSKTEKRWITATADKLRDQAIERLRYDHKTNGREAWVAAVDAISLDKVTPAGVMEWRGERIRKAELEGAAAKRSAEITTASVIRQASSLFSDRIVRFIAGKIALPDVLPFEKVKVPRGRMPRLKIEVQWPVLLASAQQELKGEALKVFFLAAGCGLRRREMDTLRWESFDFGQQRLIVQPTSDYSLKSAESHNEVILDPALVQFFRQCFQLEQAKRTDTVLAGDKKVGRTSRTYRCDATFKPVMSWLRSKGITDRKPLQHLRKLVGEQVLREHGIVMSSRFLRHASLAVTEASYIEGKLTVAPSVGAVVGDNIIPLPRAETTKPKAKNVRA